jgi:hypothetical protein
MKDDARDFKSIIEDIRAMNTYNSYFFAGILLFFGLIIGKGLTDVPKSSLDLLLLAFLFASASIFFIPLKKPQDKQPIDNAKRLWLSNLILSQFTVILTVLGVLNAIIIGFQLL